MGKGGSEKGRGREGGGGLGWVGVGAIQVLLNVNIFLINKIDFLQKVNAVNVIK